MSAWRLWLIGCCFLLVGGVVLAIGPWGLDALNRANLYGAAAVLLAQGVALLISRLRTR